MKGSPFWDVTVPRVLSSYAVGIFAILWVGFALALIVNRDWLDSLWHWVGALPIVVEVIIWLVFLPIMVGLWTWVSSWTTLITVLAIVGLVVWTFSAVSSFVKAVR